MGYVVGRWEVTRAVATGSWGSVYAARAVDRPPPEGSDEVALKFLPTGTLTARSVGHLRAMVQRERAARERLQHHGLVATAEIVTVDDQARPDLDGATVLVMELAEGSLQDLIDDHPHQPVPDADRLLREVRAALDYMHGAGWVHADLKPANVLLVDGQVRLADFGLTAELEGTHAYVPPMGTSDYLPPEADGADVVVRDEQVRGREVRTSADLWAFGVIAYRVLVGELPFGGATPRRRRESMQAYAAGDRSLPGLAAVPEPWRALVTRCLDPDPSRRSSDVEPSGGVDQNRQRHRRRGLLILAAALVVAALVFGALRFVGRVDPGPSAARAVARYPSCNGKGAWSDDFVGSTLDRSIWGEPYDGEKNKDKFRVGNLSVEDGHLVLRSTPDAGDPDSRWWTAGLGTRGSYCQTYGTWELRVRYPRSDDVHWTTMLFPPDNIGLTGPQNRWIEISRIGGGDGELPTAAIHKSDTESWGNTYQNFPAGAWHTVGVRWEPGRVDFMLDGKVLNTTTQEVPSTPRILVLRADGQGPGTLPVDFEVDWVKVSPR